MIDIRCGTQKDAEGIFEVMSKAFHIEENSSRWHSWKRLATNDATRFRVLEIDGKIISVAHIARHRLAVGSCEIAKGDVGEVSTLPEFQDKGYGSALMRDVVGWMRENDYDISRLGGYSVFYRRFGYVPFPRRFVEFTIEPVKAGANTISVEEMFKPPEGPGMVRPYDASRDAIRKDELYQLFNKGRSGSIVINLNPNAKLPTTPSNPDPLRIVYEVDGIVEGYLFATNYGRDITPFEAHITVGDIAFNPACPDALAALFRQILHFAAQNDIKRVTSRLPFDPAVLSLLTEAHITFKLEELQGAYATNMIQIINLKSLFGKIIPELEFRLRQSAVTDWRGEIEIGFDTHRVGLNISDGEVRIAPVAEGVPTMLTGQATLMKLIFGIISFDEAPVKVQNCVRPSIPELLRVWFPRQPTASGPWG
ncbi:MAG: GNAT family N-acetyltransferase [Candidatus Poribacteria bacterium]